MLTPRDLAVHAALLIDAATLQLMQIRRVDDHEAREILGLNGRHGRLGGVLYPYLRPGESRPLTYRLRRDEPELEAGQPKNKYLSPYGDARHIYFATTDPTLLADSAAPVILVEAEKSGLAIWCAATRANRRMLAVALGGCWGWRGRIGKTTTANGARVDEVGPLADLDRIGWRGRDALIAFDSNAATNPKVQAARRALGLDLAARGAHVRILDIPAEGGVNGPDDYIGRFGDERFFALVDGAPTAATADVVFRLNQRHAVVRQGGRTVVITEDHDPILHRAVLTQSTFADFRNFYLRESVVVGADSRGRPMLKPLGHAWLAHRDRRQYEGIVMSPGHDIPGYLNLWRGFAVTPAAGTCEKFKAHLFENICGGQATLYDYVFGWMAQGVQHPDAPAEVAIALRGLRGVGKGIFARAYGELFGQHYLQIANTKHLTGHFNAHLQDAIVLFADEAFWAGDKAGESVLKMLITEPVIPIERKGHDVVLTKNLLHIILASNHEWLVPAGLDERRFCVLDVDAGHQYDHTYFAAIVNELADGGRAALLHELLRVDLTDMNLRAAPETEALREQKILTLQPNERWLFDKLMTGKWLVEHDGWQTSIVKDALHADYIQSLQRVGVDRRATETELGMFISKIFREHATTIRRMVEGKLRWMWTFSDLASCRSAFDRATHSRHPWPTAE